jgi:hypothetical protein
MPETQFMMLMVYEDADAHLANGGLIMDETSIGDNAEAGHNMEPDFDSVQLQAVSFDPVSLTSTVGSSGLTLNWANYSTPLSATNLAGPWVLELGAASPSVVNPGCRHLPRR